MPDIILRKIYLGLVFFVNIVFEKTYEIVKNIKMLQLLTYSFTLM